MTNSAAPTRRVRWFRRRPPSNVTAFPRAVWWAGHAQLFIGFALLLLGPALFAIALNAPSIGRLAGAGWLMFAMAAPFACSGLMLRRFSLRLGEEIGPLWRRIVELALVVAGIAGLSIAFVFVDMFALIMGLGLLLSPH